MHMYAVLVSSMAEHIEDVEPKPKNCLLTEPQVVL